MRENTNIKMVERIVIQLLNNYYCLEGNTIKAFISQNLLMKNASSGEVNAVYKKCIGGLLHSGIIIQVLKKKNQKTSRRYKLTSVDMKIFTNGLIEGNSLMAIDSCLDVLLDLKKYQKIKMHKLYYFPSTIRYVVEDGTQEEMCYELLYLTNGNHNSILNMIKTLPSYEMNRIVVFKDDIPSAELDNFAEKLGSVVMFAQINDNGSISYFK